MNKYLIAFVRYLMLSAYRLHYSCQTILLKFVQGVKSDNLKCMERSGYFPMYDTAPQMTFNVVGDFCVSVVYWTCIWYFYCEFICIVLCCDCIFGHCIVYICIFRRIRTLWLMLFFSIRVWVKFILSYLKTIINTLSGLHDFLINTKRH